MSLLAWLPLAASTLFSEKIPTLSEPRMIQIPAGTTLSVDGDSVIVGSKGLAQHYYRTGSKVTFDGERRSDTISLDTPNLGYGGVLPKSGSMFYPTSPKYHYKFQEIRIPFVELGEGFHRLESASSGYTEDSGAKNIKLSEQNILACGEKAIYRMNRNDSSSANPYIVTQIRRFQGAGHSFCAAKSWLKQDAEFLPETVHHTYTFTSQAIIQWPLGNGYWAVQVDSANKIVGSNRYDSIPTSQLDWMVADSSVHRWLSFNQSASTLFWRAGDPKGLFKIDSLKITGLSTEKRPCYQVRIKDSIVTFAVDSQIIFLKWTPSHVQVLARYSIPGKIIQAATMEESNQRSNYLWATTGTELYSFKFSMEEPPLSSVASPTRSALFALQHNPQGASFTWYGSGTEIVRMTGIDGRAHGTVELRPGATANWTAPHPGLYLAHTPDGVKRVLAR
ncbi:MAG: hypothetical protein IPK50_03250 [Fibrobacterota bacterium]|nr:hypothetical protein [Fibrobacterota bacterium]QQS05913.1 MAG: hypothetical protein IPK50_03250 [Fibrobacterota bacterium]